MYRGWRRRKKPKPGIHGRPPLRRGKGGLWDIGSQSCPTAQRFVSDPPAIPRLGTIARRNFSSRCAIPHVSRPAGSLKFNLRGRRYAVPANGCLVTLMRWPNLQRIQFGKPAQTVNPATVASPEILPISPRRCVFSLDKSLSWMSFELFHFDRIPVGHIGGFPGVLEEVVQLGLRRTDVLPAPGSDSPKFGPAQVQ